ncbi:hypothetical protein [Flavobacterium sp. ZS1P14]|uniref:hypothetical protein n=1 Tax=Flavobacterium sp. ZS1P14 TaxID=3401729 RepID=UPI003AAD6368
MYKNIIKADYLQRSRSYVFLITLLVSIYMAYSFIPGYDSHYTTVRVNNFIGKNNSAWIGHVTAIMASTFLWIIGFYLVNNSIKRDKETGVGQIIATTSISNFGYLLAKVLSNFCVLLTITFIIILMALGIYVFRGESGSFDIIQFFMPYLLATIPSIFLVSVMAIVFEVIFGNKTNLLNVAFFFLFGIIIAKTNGGNNPGLEFIDPLGIKYLTNQMVEVVNTISPSSTHDVSAGYLFSENQKKQYFNFQGSVWSIFYVLSRIIWIAIGFGLLFITSKIFNRFDSKTIVSSKKKSSDLIINRIKTAPKEIQLSKLSKTNLQFGIFPLIKTEFLMLIRKGPKWFWLINFGGMIALFLMPIKESYQIALPVLWFLQINRWADLSTKEKFFGTSNFIYASFNPLQRLLTSQILAGFLLATFLALPIVIRQLINGNFIAAMAIIVGSLFLVSFAVFSGIISGGKRLFEILFFAITYAIINDVPFVDYFGGFHQDFQYLIIMIVVLLLTTSFLFRNQEIKNQ